jgi:integrase/recombinase XerC
LKSFSAFAFKDQASLDQACLDQACLDQACSDQTCSAQAYSAQACSDEVLLSALNPSEIRGYEVHLLDVEKVTPRSVNLHLSVLSGFCRFLVKEGLLKSNPVRLVHRPKVEKRLPEFYRQDSMDAYFEKTAYYVSDEAMTIYLHDVQSDTGKKMYERRLARLIISMFFGLGLRRSELIGLKISSVDFLRKVVTVVGKGNKTRAIPLADSLAAEIKMYLKAAEALVGLRAVDHVSVFRTPGEPLLITYTGRALYPVYVDRVVKNELVGYEGFTGRKSPHVLRHSIATSLLNEGAQLNSIKEMLGHSSLAATQVYTHNSITKLQQVYKAAHPRAKK